MFGNGVSNNLSTIKKSPNPKARYNLANASTRIFTRIIDIILSTLFCVIIACIILLTDTAFKGDFKSFVVSEPWRYFLFGFFCFVSNFAYFILFPYKFNGQTIGMKLFKIATINLIFTHWLTNLIKKELFLWLLMSFVNLVLSFTLFLIGILDSPTAANSLIKELINFNYDSTYKPISAIFSSLYGVCGLIFILIFFSTVLNSKRPAIHDKFSNTVVVKLVDVSKTDSSYDNLNNKKKMPTRNYKLPGGIIDSANDEISSI